MHIECVPEPNYMIGIRVVSKITYEGVDDEGNESPKPITFRKSPFDALDEPREGLCLYRQNPDGNWQRCELREYGYTNYDHPNIRITVGDGTDNYSDQFISLSPDETWEDSFPVGSEELPEDVETSDLFMYVNKGAMVDWWDWGAKDEHQNTVVELPYQLDGEVVDPPDNNGKPKLIVPVSNKAYFSYVP